MLLLRAQNSYRRLWRQYPSPHAKNTYRLAWHPVKPTPLEQVIVCLRDGRETQPPVDRRFRPVPSGSEWFIVILKPPRTGRNRRSIAS